MPSVDRHLKAGLHARRLLAFNKRIAHLLDILDEQLL